MAQPKSTRRWLFLGLLWASCCIACGVLVIGVIAIFHPGLVHEVAKRWKESDGRFECQLVLDPGLTPGGIHEDNERASRLYAELSRLKGGLEAGLGAVDERTGPVNGRMCVSVWDYSAGSRLGVTLWLSNPRNGSTTADACVTWIEESGTETGHLGDLHGVIRISDVECLNRAPTGKQQCVIEYELTGKKRYQGATSEVTTASKLTMWL